jgi:hypothetical protein
MDAFIVGVTPGIFCSRWIGRVSLHSGWISILAVCILTIAVIFLIVARDWRVRITSLSVIYGGVFVLVFLSWPITLALVKLVAGWMSGAILGMALTNYSKEGFKFDATQPDVLIRGNTQSIWANRIFQIFFCALIILVVLSVTHKLIDIVPSITYEQAFAGLLLIGMGLLQLSQVSEPDGVCLGLLVFLAGFETLYAVVETSTLLAGLLASVNLGIALVGAYLIANWIEVER